MWRRTWPLGVLLLATACGVVDAGDDMACTAIGTPVGVSVDVEHPDAVAATIEVCWDGSCATPALELHPSSRAVETTCTGTSPDDSCSARSEPTGGKHGFASLPRLPAKPVTATLRVLDQAGSPLVDRDLALNPEPAHPNGPNCPAGGPQARISVGADGSVSAR
ncbi:hypothetical protein [Saccharothrix sp. S26]|uniref:hypothetical protein n=1 Tax=Saccharothrix sp. S26 TaxID=2907215 RepID=UPI001F157555|nr:hypothetical protein [Saccharothrix sp. S26]